MDETEFRIVELEYKQASLLIQRGTEIFIRIVKLFIYSNISLLLLVNLWLKFGSTQNVRLFASYIALLGIAVCLSMFIFQKMMVICVRRWLERASELEAQFGGRIFTRTLDIEKQNSEQRRAAVSGLAPSLCLVCSWVGGDGFCRPGGMTLKAAVVERPIACNFNGEA